mmetsp:Transcript_20827/g.48080  ORF Transcript_20827/g.48080 Transcript_20827/m.48080 type:complete len:109 (+) Transcript_20827:301-627(+)
MRQQAMKQQRRDFMTRLSPFVDEGDAPEGSPAEWVKRALRRNAPAVFETRSTRDNNKDDHDKNQMTMSLLSTGHYRRTLEDVTGGSMIPPSNFWGSRLTRPMRYAYKF